MFSDVAHQSVKVSAVGVIWIQSGSNQDICGLSRTFLSGWHFAWMVGRPRFGFRWKNVEE